MVLAAITILYVPNVIGGALVWPKLPILFGTSGESITESYLKESHALSTSGSNGILGQLVRLPAFIVADGLLVRYPCYGFDSLLHSLDLAMLPSME